LREENMVKRLLALLVVFVVPVCAQAQTPLFEEARKPKPKPDCSDGVKYDDGKLGAGLRGILDYRTNIVMLFEAPSYPAKIERICISWWRTIIGDTAIYFDLKVWDADGPDGAPGTLLATIPGLVAGRLPLNTKWYSYDISSQGIVINGPVYIGPSWYPGDAFSVYLSMDEGPKIPRRRGFFGVDEENTDDPPSRELGVLGNQPAYRAFGIRAKFGRAQ
jgi:hypothetical protein